MPTQCKPLSFAFQGCQGRRVAAGPCTAPPSPLLPLDVGNVSPRLTKPARTSTRQARPRRILSPYPPPAPPHAVQKPYKLA